VTREDLISLFARARGEAVATCLSVLAEPTTRVSHSPETASTQNLLSIYRRRVEHIRAIRLPALGVAEAVEALASTKYQRLCVVPVQPEAGLP
jgi:hypothetical protein